MKLPKLDTPRKKFLAAVVIVIIILLLIFVVSQGGEETDGPGRSTTISTSPTPITQNGQVLTPGFGGVLVNEEGKIVTNNTESEWTEYYVDDGVRVKLPPEAEVSLDKNNAIIVDVGTDNGSLEGGYELTLVVNIYNANGRSVLQIANSDLQSSLSEAVSLIQPVTSINYGENRGYTYSVSGLGDVVLYYFDLGNGQYLRITLYPQNPNDQLTFEIVNTILSSLKY